MGCKNNQVRRWVWLAGMIAVAGSSAFATWWMTTLSGLPDIGDPFDVAAFTSSAVPDEENAFVLYREAVGKFVKEPSDLTYDWATASPVAKGWLARNREPLETWRRGTERPGSLYIPVKSLTIETQLPVVQDLRGFARLAQLEGSRLEAEGDLEGARRWHRAIFRSSRHLGRRATAIERLVGGALHQVASRQMTRWASDPRVTPPMLRAALDGVLSDYAMSSPVSDMLKVEYLVFIKTYNNSDLVWKALNDTNTSGGGKPAWYARDLRFFSVAKSLKNEPERTKRVARLIYANLLAVCDLPPDRRPPVATTLTANFAGGPAPLLDLYALDDSAPILANALTPDKVRQWFDSTLYAKQLIPMSNALFKSVERERATQANLVIALANRLFMIERGKPAETVEELVGPYLQALPEGYKPAK